MGGKLRRNSRSIDKLIIIKILIRRNRPDHRDLGPAKSPTGRSKLFWRCRVRPRNGSGSVSLAENRERDGPPPRNGGPWCLWRILTSVNRRYHAWATIDS
jgi:hypothetical protein